MKMLFQHCGFLPAALLVAFSLAAPGQTTKSPVGTWDCVISGAENGLAYVTFREDGSLEGREILVPKRATTNQTLVSTIPLTGLGVPPPPVVRPSLYGSFPVRGTWGFDSQGRVIGFFNELTALVCLTNAVLTNTIVFESPGLILETNVSLSSFCETFPVSTNLETEMFVEQRNCYQIVTNCTSFTNTFNFLAKPVPNKRITLVGRTPIGKFSWTGVPETELADIGGSWYGVKKHQGVSSYEFLSLGSYGSIDVSANVYAAVGSGADYFYNDGVAILSSKKKLAFAASVFDLEGAYRSTRAVMGPFKIRKISSKMTGLDTAPGTGSATNRVSFEMTKRTSVP